MGSVSLNYYCQYHAIWQHLLRLQADYMACIFKIPAQLLSTLALQYAVCIAGIHSNCLRVLCRPSKRACSWDPHHWLCAILNSPRHKAHWLRLACRAWRWHVHLCQDCHQVIFGFKSISCVDTDARVSISSTHSDMKRPSCLTAGFRIPSAMFPLNRFL